MVLSHGGKQLPGKYRSNKRRLSLLTLERHHLRQIATNYGLFTYQGIRVVSVNTHHPVPVGAITDSGLSFLDRGCESGWRRLTTRAPWWVVGGAVGGEGAWGRSPRGREKEGSLGFPEAPQQRPTRAWR